MNLEDRTKSNNSTSLKCSSQTESRKKSTHLDAQYDGILEAMAISSEPATYVSATASHTLGLVPPELHNKLFSSLATKPELAASQLPTANPCPICHNFSEQECDNIEFADAKSRAGDGCLGCKLIACAFERYTRESFRKAIRRSRRSRKSNSVRTVERKLTALICFDDYTIRIKAKKVQPEGQKLSERDVIPNEEVVHYEIFTTAAVAPRDFSVGIPQRQLRFPFSNSGSRESFDLITRWLDDCSQQHPRCAQVAAKLPRRVLDLEASTGLRLIYGAGKSGRFCALSHCWGPSADSRPACTTQATLDSHLSSIDERLLSKTFRDAISLARHLSIRYLWIDSLCIVQDDGDDWARESAKMASIYSNACLVIAATQAEHGDVGCFSERSKPDATLCFDIPLVDGQKALIYIREQKDQNIHIRGLKDHQHFDPPSAHSAQPDPQYPLLSRAWCLQERLLATRMVHFAGDEIFWECRNTTLCECGLLDKASGTGPYFRQRWTSDYELPDLFDLWHKTLQLYSSLNITYESDRLPALSGLSRHLQAQGCGEYVYGVWMKNLFPDLLWVSTNGGTRPTVWKAPSWSWACADGFSLIFMVQQDPAVEEVVDIENLWGTESPTKTGGGATFHTTFESLDYVGNKLFPSSKTDTPILSISAPAISVSFRKNSDFWALYKGGRELKVVNCLDCPDNFNLGVTSSLLCVWIGTIHSHDYVPMRPQILLLQPYRGLGGKRACPGCYERAGMVYFRGHDENEKVSSLLDWFRDAEVQVILIA